MRRRWLGAWVAIGFVAGVAACDPGGGETDAGGGETDAGPGIDAGGTDAGRADAGAPDGGAPDGGAPDGGAPDLCAGVDCTSLDDACNVGTCDPATGTCAASPRADGTACDDADACTTGDVCTAGACAGAAVDCSGMDGVCVVGMCDATTGGCVVAPSPDGTACDDGFVCTGASLCASGACAGTGLACTAVQPDLTMVTLTMPAGGVGGSAVAEDCPTGQVLTGFVGEIETGNGLVDRPGATFGVCSTVAVDPSSGAITTTPVGMTARIATGDDPVSGRVAYSAVCPANQVVVGYSAYAGVHLYQLTVRCAPLSLGLADAGFPILTGAASDLTPIGVMSGSATGPADCGPGEAAVGVDGRAGAWIDRWALRCAPLEGVL